MAFDDTTVLRRNLFKRKPGKSNFDYEVGNHGCMNLKDRSLAARYSFPDLIECLENDESAFLSRSVDMQTHDFEVYFVFANNMETVARLKLSYRAMLKGLRQ